MRAQLLKLHERLQLNLVHQSQLLQHLNSGRFNTPTVSFQVEVQKLSYEQQQLVLQIQLQQKSLNLQQGLSSSNQHELGISCGESSTDTQKLLEALRLGNVISYYKEEGLLNPTLTPNSTYSAYLNGFSSASLLLQQQRPPEDYNLTSVMTSTHPLYDHGICLWPGCKVYCKTYSAFMQHLDIQHIVDYLSAAQCQSQMQVVDQLETQIKTEQGRLQAMLQHLQMMNQIHCTTVGNGSDSRSNSISITESHLLSPNWDISPVDLPVSNSVNSKSSFTANILLPTTSPSPNVYPKTHSPCETVETGETVQYKNGNNDVAKNKEHSQLAEIRRQMSENEVESISADMDKNRDLYSSHPIRPRFSLASLIRQSIMNSKEKQLSLNDIYIWFTDKFAYFRGDSGNWKNGVRHNLSLHKCFLRVMKENKGMWIVNDNEYFKRRRRPRFLYNICTSTPYSCISTNHIRKNKIKGNKQLNSTTLRNMEINNK